MDSVGRPSEGIAQEGRGVIRQGQALANIRPDRLQRYAELLGQQNDSRS